MEYLDYYDEEMDSAVTTESIIKPLESCRELLKLSDNPDNLCELDSLMKSKAFLNLHLGIDGNLPYYEFEVSGFSLKLFVNPELENYILSYLLSGNIPSKRPNTFF